MTTVADMNYYTIVTPCGEEYAYSLPGDTLSMSEDIRTDYYHGHYFSPGAVSFFGVRNFRTVAPGVSVECQTNAPAGVGQYKVTAWRESEHGPEVWHSCHHKTRRDANACAIATYRKLHTVG